MNEQLLEDIGLTKAQSQAYKALVEQGPSAAPAIAQVLHESRSNTYKVLDKLCELGLASRDPYAKRVMYVAASPAALAAIVQKHTEEAQLQERRLNAELPRLLDFFFAHSEQPSIRFYQGKEGVKQAYADILATTKTLYLVRSPEDVHFYDEQFFAELRNKRRLLGVRTVAITPDVPSANHDPVVDDKNKFTRVWIPADAYTANVEWNIAGDKVALISYGKESMAVVIESPQIAESFRQVFHLAEAARAPWHPAAANPSPQTRAHRRSS